jgi:hypothetical protein
MAPGQCWALLEGERVIGWSLTQRLRHDALTWSASWAHPALRRRAGLIVLYGHAARAQRAALPGVPFVNLVVPTKFPRMVAFAQREFQPYAVRHDWFLTASIAFPAAPAPAP